MSTCVHHWRLATPTGASLVDAYCLNCGKTRKYQASLEYVFDREDNLTIRYQKNTIVGTLRERLL